MKSDLKGKKPEEKSEAAAPDPAPVQLAVPQVQPRGPEQLANHVTIPQAQAPPTTISVSPSKVYGPDGVEPLPVESPAPATGAPRPPLTAAPAVASYSGIAGSPAAQAAPPLFWTLLSALLDLSFSPEFTVKTLLPADNKHSGRATDANKNLWCHGVQADKQHFGPGVRRLPANGAENRIAVLKLLLATCSKPLYIPSPQLEPRASPFLSFLTSPRHPKALPLFKSMLNYFIGYDPVGYGIPYGASFSPDVEGIDLAELCGQTVVLLADFWPLTRSRPALPEAATDEQPPWETGSNKLSGWLAGLADEADFLFLLDGITGLLLNPLEADTGWLPGNYNKVRFESMLVMLLWRLFETNHAFKAYAIRSETILKTIVPILYYMHERRLDPASSAFVRIGIYVLIQLSSDRNFAVRLNREFEPTFRLGVAGLHGNHGDLIILVIYALLLGRNLALLDLYHHLLTVVVNISPYIKAVSMNAADKLVHLFEVFSAPQFLFAAPYNHQLVMALIEMYNNMIQYQFDGNHHLVYVIIRRRKAFLKLAAISSPDADIDQDDGLDAPVVAYDPHKPLESLAPNDAAKAKNTPSKVKSSLSKNRAMVHFSVNVSDQLPEATVTVRPIRCSGPSYWPHLACTARSSL